MAFTLSIRFGFKLILLRLLAYFVHIGLGYHLSSLDVNHSGLFTAGFMLYQCVLHCLVRLQISSLDIFWSFASFFAACIELRNLSKLNLQPVVIAPFTSLFICFVNWFCHKIYPSLNLLLSSGLHPWNLLYSIPHFVGYHLLLLGLIFPAHWMFFEVRLGSTCD